VAAELRTSPGRNIQSRRIRRKEARSMKLSRTLSTLLVLGLVLAGAAHGRAAEKIASPAASKYLLKYKFGMSEELRYQVKQSSNMKSTVDGSTQSVKTQTDSVKVWRVTDVLPSGEMEFIHLVESVKMTNETPGQQVRSFDSTSTEKPAPGFEAAARAVGQPLIKVRISPNGKVLSRTEIQPQQAAPSEDLPIMLELPDAEVAVGDKWDHVYDVVVKKQSGVETKIRTRRVCQLKEVTSGVAVIEVEYQILTPADPYIRAQIVERLTKGVVRFDIERGRVVQQEHNVDRREIGFASKQTASSMHFVSRTQERLLDGGPAKTVDKTDLAQVKQTSATE
jgi:hypothetical protein